MPKRKSSQIGGLVGALQDTPSLGGISNSIQQITQALVKGGSGGATTKRPNSVQRGVSGSTLPSRELFGKGSIVTRVNSKVRGR